MSRVASAVLVKTLPKALAPDSVAPLLIPSTRSPVISAAATTANQGLSTRLPVRPRVDTNTNAEPAAKTPAAPRPPSQKVAVYAVP
jgi:hypothetical protein